MSILIIKNIDRCRCRYLISKASNIIKVVKKRGNSQPKTEISRILEQKSPSMRDFNQEGSVQPEQVLKGTQGAQTALKIPSGGSDNTSSPSSQPSKFSAGSKAKGAAKTDFARRQTTNKPTSGKSSGTIFAEAFTAKPNFPARPGGNGLFGQFSPRPTPDFSNPGCGGGPRSVTVLSGQQNPNSSREITCHDGLKAILTDKSANHLTSKHGHEVGIDDPLPPNPSQKPTKYKQVRTRINNENKEKFGDILEKILQDPNTEPFPGVSIRGINGQGYYTKDYGENGFFIGIHTEGQFAGQIIKAQPISQRQLEFLRELKILD